MMDARHWLRPIAVQEVPRMGDSRRFAVCGERVLGERYREEFCITDTQVLQSNVPEALYKEEIGKATQRIEKRVAARGPAHPLWDMYMSVA